MLRQALPQHAVLVGQGISHDVQWVTLQEGSDFQVPFLDYPSKRLLNQYF